MPRPPPPGKTLFLLRHAKSSWSLADVADHDRPLAPRGTLAAGQIGRHMQAQGWRPDLTLCSTATRSRQTLALVDHEFPERLARIDDDSVYLCGAHRLMKRLREVPEDWQGAQVGSLMLVAHNPDLQELALHLAADRSPGLSASITEKFPTGALAVFHLDIARWQDLTAARSRLIAYTTPRSLATLTT